MLLNQKQVDRFWGGVQVLGPDVCWNWQRWCYPRGYGYFGSMEQSNRVAWVLDRNRQIPDLFEGYPSMICHDCDNPPCCNPNHLFLGNQQYNMIDSVIKGRSAAFNRKGANNPRVYITKSQAKEIQQFLRECILTQEEIAERFGVCRTIVSDINTGKHWSHVKDEKEW